MRPVWILTTTLVISACANGPTRRTYDGADTASPVPSKNTGRSSGNPMAKNEAVRRAQALYAKGDFKNALATLNVIPEGQVKGSELTEYWNLKGLVELASKAPSAAEVSFQKAIQANSRPEYAGYYQYNLATAFAEEGKKEDALRALNLVDLAKMDLPDQRKVDVLREKVMMPSGQNTISAEPVAPVPNAPGNPNVSASATPEPYRGPVNPNRIGLLLPLSGKYEAFGKKVQRAIELAFQHSSNSHAKDIELVPMDAGEYPPTQQAALKKLVEEQQVIAVIGPLLSKGITTLSEMAEHYQVPLVSIAQVQGTASPHLFSCSISTQDQAAKMADYAMKVRGFRRFAILGASNKAGEETAHAFWDEVLARGGEVRAFELYDPDLTDFRAPVDKAIGIHYTEAREKELKELAEKRAELKITKKTMKTQQYFSLPPIVDFDAVFIADEAKTVGQIMPTFAYRDARNLPYLGITSWNSNQLVARAQDQAEGATFPVVFNTLLPPPETKRFYELYSSTYSTNPGELDALAFDAANLVIQVMSDRPDSRADFNEKFEKISDVEGATGRVSVKEHRCVRNLAVYTVKKGEFQVVQDAEK
ncbi:MAG: penicillin-binding protein activator [Bdellovibrionales bacterium]|nr:penicillin-binding protein activator [Oligoflexia bacterium]